MTGLQHLKQLHVAGIRERYPSLPEAAIAVPAYSDRTANGLTKCIVAYITFIGGWATRVNTAGRMIDRGTEVRQKMVYIPGTTKRGTADIMGVVRGVAVSIEVKIGRDRQSAHQRQVEHDVTNAGGVYYIARDFESTYRFINEL